MQNLWNDADAAALDGLDLLVYTSRLVGADTSLVVWGAIFACSTGRWWHVRHEPA